LLRHRFVPQRNFKAVCDSIFFRQPTRVDHPLRQFSFEVRQCEAEIDPGICGGLICANT